MVGDSPESKDSVSWCPAVSVWTCCWTSGTVVVIGHNEEWEKVTGECSEGGFCVVCCKFVLVESVHVKSSTGTMSSRSFCEINLVSVNKCSIGGKARVERSSSVCWRSNISWLVSWWFKCWQRGELSVCTEWPNCLGCDFDVAVGNKGYSCLSCE